MNVRKIKKWQAKKLYQQRNSQLTALENQPYARHKID